MLGWFLEQQARQREFDTEVTKLTESLDRDYGERAVQVAREKAARSNIKAARKRIYRAVAKALEQRQKRRAAAAGTQRARAAN
jgi:hypothetical protein